MSVAVNEIQHFSSGNINHFLKNRHTISKGGFFMDKSKEIQKQERQQQREKSTAVKGDKKLNGPNRPST